MIIGTYLLVHGDLTVEQLLGDSAQILGPLDVRLFHLGRRNVENRFASGESLFDLPLLWLAGESIVLGESEFVGVD